LVDKFTKQNAPIYAKLNLPVFLFFTILQPIGVNPYLKDFEKVAEVFENRVLFSIGDGTDDDILSLMDSLGIENRRLPSMAFSHSHNPQIFPDNL
jgi:hypothetical protein